jgi:uncharacterized membrane protein YeaQ/YmgE (transglycosylase-associated protein family)
MKDKRYSTGGAMLGLVLGALAGAWVFNLWGSLDMGMGCVSIMIFSIVGALVGSQVARFVKLSRPVIDVPPVMDAPLYTEPSLDDLRDQGDHSIPNVPQTYTVDALRLVLLAAVFSIVGAVFAYFELLTGGASFPFFLICSVFFFGVGLYHLATLLVNLNLQVEVDSRGLLYSSYLDRRLMQWSEIYRVLERHQKHTVNMIPVLNIHTLVISNHVGDQIKLDRTLKGIDDLAKTVQITVTKQLLTGAIKTLKSGGNLNFDAFSITSQGIQRKQKFLPWNEVDKMIINQGHVSVKRTGKNWLNWADVRVWDIANIPLFLIIAGQYARLEG